MTIALPQQNIKMDVLTGIDPVWYDKLKALTDAVNLLGGVSPTVSANLIRASLGADVLLNDTTRYFDGPSVAQGTIGTWFASGSITVTDTTAARIDVKLWDGTTVIASAQTFIPGASQNMVVALSGFITSPANNLRLSAKDEASVNGKILFNQSGNSKDATISAFRIA